MRQYFKYEDNYLEDYDIYEDYVVLSDNECSEENPDEELLDNVYYQELKTLPQVNPWAVKKYIVQLCKCNFIQFNSICNWNDCCGFVGRLCYIFAQSRDRLKTARRAKNFTALNKEKKMPKTLDFTGEIGVFYFVF